MSAQVATALRFAQELRGSRGFRQLDAGARNSLERDLQRLETTLGRDPYAQSLDAGDLESRLRQSAGGGAPQATGGQGSNAAQVQPPAPAAPPPQAQTATIGQRAAEALEAVNFPGFVASLLTGTFQAIVDATVQQVREYARAGGQHLPVARGLHPRQRHRPTRRGISWREQFPQDLSWRSRRRESRAPRNWCRARTENGHPPEWLSRFGLEGAELTRGVTDGPLLEAGQRQVGEQRIQALATMVLMGINRVVVNEGDVRAKLQFHAAASRRQKADVDQQAMSIAAPARAAARPCR